MSGVSRLSPAWYAQLLEQIPWPILLIDGDRRIVLANQALETVSRLPKSEFVNHHVSDFGVGPEVLAAVEAALGPGDRTILDFEARIGEREVRQARGAFAPLRDPNGDLIGCVVALDDLADSLRIQSELERARHLSTLGELAAYTAHELKNPLTSIRATAQLVKSLPQSEARNFLDLIVNEVDRMNDFIGEWLLLARPSVVDLAPEDVLSLVQEVLAALPCVFQESQVCVLTEYAKGLPRVMMNRKLLSHAIRNLLANAVEATPPGGCITVGVQPLANGTGVSIRIQDDGPGMPPEVLARLFEPFMTTKPNGTGLGIPVCHQIVTLSHKGRLRFETSPGAGTIAFIELPSAG